MNETIKCPDCGGSKCQNVSGNTYRCLYCGSTFSVKSNPEPQYTPPVAPVPPPVAQPQVIYVQQQPQPQAPVLRGNKSKTTALLLTFFLGGLGIEWFYLGKTGTGIVALLTCWTGIPAIIAIVHFIVLLCTSEQEFNRQYNS